MIRRVGAALALSALSALALAPAAYALTGTAPDGSTFDAGNAVTVADEGHGFPVAMSDYDAEQLGLVAERTADDHHEEQDGCDHGATSVPCRPDPSPNGKDCDAHGNHGGINEDHCEGTTTSTSSTTPATQPPTTTTTTSRSSVTGPTVTSTTTTATSGPSSSTTPTPSTPSPVAPGVESASRTGPASPAELPATGAATATLLFLAAWFILGGLAAFLTGAVIAAGHGTAAPAEEDTGAAVPAEQLLDAGDTSVPDWGDYDDDSHLAQWDDDPSPYSGTYSED